MPKQCNVKTIVIFCMFFFWGVVYAAVCPCPEYMFGKNTAGNDSFDFSGNFNASVYTLAADNTASSIHLRFVSGAGQARVAIYSDNGGQPGNLIVQSDEETIAAVGWGVFDIPDTFLTAGTYWLALQHTAGLAAGVVWTGQAKEWYYPMTYGSFPAVADSLGYVGDGDYDMYVSYCPAICNTPTYTPTITPTFTASPTPISSCECLAAFGKFTTGPGSANIQDFISMNWYGLYEDRIAMSITLGVITGSGNARVAIYSDTTNMPGVPFMLMSQSASVPVSAGENVIPIPQVYMEQDRVYWIAVQTQGVLNVGGAQGAAGDNRYAAYSYGDFPSLAPVMTSHNINWDLRVNYCPIICPSSPTATPTPTPTMAGSTMTATPVATTTYTSTQAWTQTQTATLTRTPTQTATLTRTPTQTATFTLTPPATATLSATMTFTVVPTLSYTVTPTRTPTAAPPPVQSGRFVLNELLIYPNPVNTKNQAAIMRLRYSGYAQEAYLSIYTVNMRLVRKYNIGSLSTGEHSFVLPPEDAAGLSAGIYYVAIRTESEKGKTKIQKIEKFIIWK